MGDTPTGFGVYILSQTHVSSYDIQRDTAGMFSGLEMNPKNSYWPKGLTYFLFLAIQKTFRPNSNLVNWAKKYNTETLPVLSQHQQRILVHPDH